MSKKRRFRRKALGRIKMFFQVIPYTGYANTASLIKLSNVTKIFEKNITTVNHYKKCYKKKNLLHPQLGLPA
jgi:hypothetical protein